MSFPVPPFQRNTPTQNHLESTTIGVIRKAKQNSKKGENSNSSKLVQPCILYEEFRHLTHICHEIDELKTIMNASRTLVAPTPPKGAKVIPLCNKEVCTNHVCTICDKYGHYTHHYPNIPEIQKTLKVLIQTNDNEPIAKPHLHKMINAKTSSTYRKRHHLAPHLPTTHEGRISHISTPLLYQVLYVMTLPI